MNQNEYLQNCTQDEQKEEKECLNRAGLGAFLRNERLKKGLDHQQVFNITRLQPHILNALENEDWQSLPSPVLVKGFIRSYARTLGLDDETALGLYGDCLRSEIAASNVPVRPSERRRRLLIIIVIASLAVISISAYFWADFSFIKGVVQGTGMPERPADNHIKAESSVNIPARRDIKKEVSYGEDESGPEISEIYNPSPLLGNEASALSNPDGSVEVEFSDSAKINEGGLVLNAEVSERTWISITADGQDPKEYIFQPGSRPEWKAAESFELCIGNAGGIAFDLNGRKMEHLGESGQVVRINLPEYSNNRSSRE
ncbi:MAG: helix-turn-helix domain-containing protein [Deltaproteobacteria bacterium]|nr:helix-turn-helix domain-containing protein [Deltaproteobacteria bacterium]